MALPLQNQHAKPTKLPLDTRHVRPRASRKIASKTNRAARRCAACLSSLAGQTCRNHDAQAFDHSVPALCHNDVPCKPLARLDSDKRLLLSTSFHTLFNTKRHMMFFAACGRIVQCVVLRLLRFVPLRHTAADDQVLQRRRIKCCVIETVLFTCCAPQRRL